MRAIFGLGASFLCIASCSHLAAKQPKSAAPVAQIRSGSISGYHAGDIDVFRGIPYVAAPLGIRRWAPPQAPLRWGGTRSAVEFGPSCPQPQLPAPFGVDGPKSEDCLYLNIWKPSTLGRHKRPVLVWIHGGAFLIGSGSQPLYDGSRLARRGVIVVTINYRLGALGFLTHRALRTERVPSANFGLLDQIAALQWIKRNIAAFGGDPHNITIAGESAGGVSVQALMASPVARGLFDKAIIQSGGGLAALADARSEMALAAGDAWAKSVGAPDATAADLRALSVEKILSAPFIAFPSVDGNLLDRNPAETFARGEEAKVPLLIGANSWEGSLRILSDAFAQGLLGHDYDVLLQSYVALGQNEASARDRLRGDLFFVQPARFLAEHHVAVSPTWFYHFDMVPASLRSQQPGTAHGGELAYLFGTPDAALVSWDDRDRMLSSEMMDYWSRFVATGDPNGRGLPVWQDARTGRHLLLRRDVRMVTPTGQDNRVYETVTAAAKAWTTGPDQADEPTPKTP
ncbi:carboxylesterase/lipase family protein [Sphingopyxis granuli]|uniref:Carboxylic ester hydrolase n=1 Tax=Sphingopyxis granuli TaxID=267128 RepID=A0AA86L3N7_9SPHN|nr:carboxylesterase/lipase family protein [Sphingopyxis granuli]AMG74125.1 Carboxylic ester hydrolase [Sphingopyxis granuli]QUM70762.1 carboxylesterase family protein [Sphingopyxis granuli]